MPASGRAALFSVGIVEAPVVKVSTPVFETLNCVSATPLN